jgi:hypothetical protein
MRSKAAAKGKRFEDAKGVIRSLTSKDRQNNHHKKKTNTQTVIYKTIHRKLKIKI